jgi:hypothetical protein
MSAAAARGRIFGGELRVRLMTLHALAGLAGAALVGGCSDSQRAGSTASAPGTPGATANRSCPRPYSGRSPWNTPIQAGASYDPSSGARLRRIDSELTSDPTQYTYPVYRVSRGTPRARVTIRGVFSDVFAGGRRMRVRQHVTVSIPVPSGATGAAGSDAQIVILNRATGDEWGAWQLTRSGGGYSAENGYHYNTRWTGVPPRSDNGSSFGSRGAGVPYLAGLVRPCEVARGRINHALAFAYDSPSPRHVYPATKSDGSGRGPSALPEGTRLQLDPSLSAARIRSWGCRGVCATAARALQRYGMYVIDGSGRPKLIFEYEGTAHWGDTVTAQTVSPIPISAFRVLR